MPIRYRPEPGSTESRVVELLRFLPAGTALHGGDLDARLGLGERRGLHSLLQASVDHGLLRAEKRAMSGPLAVWHITHNCPPLPGHLVYRGCQHRLCLNPRHLHIAASRKDIGAHIRRLGTRKGKCTETRLANLRRAQIASGSVPTPDEIVLAIRAVPRSDATNRALARRFNVAEQVVSRIRRGESYRHLLAPSATPAP